MKPLALAAAATGLALAASQPMAQQAAKAPPAAAPAAPPAVAPEALQALKRMSAYLTTLKTMSRLVLEVSPIVLRVVR